MYGNSKFTDSFIGEEVHFAESQTNIQRQSVVGRCSIFLNFKNKLLDPELFFILKFEGHANDGHSLGNNKMRGDTGRHGDHIFHLCNHNNILMMVGRQSLQNDSTTIDY